MNQQEVYDPLLQSGERRLASAIESLLFVAGCPLTRAELRKLLDINEQQLERGLTVLEQLPRVIPTAAIADTQNLMPNADGEGKAS